MEKHNKYPNKKTDKVRTNDYWGYPTKAVNIKESCKENEKWVAAKK